jgi:hypothetical protein
MMTLGSSLVMYAFPPSALFIDDVLANHLSIFGHDRSRDDDTPALEQSHCHFDTLPVFGVLFGRTMFRSMYKTHPDQPAVSSEQDYLERGIRYRIIDDTRFGSAPDFVEMSSLDAMTSPHIAVDHPDAEIKVR